MKTTTEINLRQIFVFPFERFITILFCLLIMAQSSQLTAQTSNNPGSNGIQTYVNPILPGDHPDQTMLRMGNNFYSTGSNFHFTPYLPILHSTDLMHWEVIARVIPPTSSIPNNDAPQAGSWQGALAYFNNKYWVYFSNNAGGGQYFCNATNPAGPWSSPVKVNTNTGVYGYDNSIFVDDDGTPYMLLKNGQDNNGLQKLGMDGQPVGSAINMNWINANGHPYSWAEGPVMCKRNGRYYLFVAGDVSGGQYVLSTANLTSGESGWTRHGTFWQTTSSAGGFTGPNHVTQPIKLDDGTWWCLSHAYDNAGYNGQGRQSHLHQVVWDNNGVPKGIPVNVNPVLGPNLPSSNISYDFGKSDYFSSTNLGLNWHFFSKAYASTSRYSLSEKPGYLRLKPGSTTTHVLQKDKGKYYSLTTKVDFSPTANGQEAGLRMMNGWNDAYFNLYVGYNGGSKIGMNWNGTKTEVNNTIGNTVWLRIERSLHILTCYYSADGSVWTQLGTRDITTLDASQHDWNAWVGTSVGLFSTNLNADFDLYSYRYGFVPIKVAGRNNWFGTTASAKTPGTVMTNSTTGDWLMMAGVDLGSGTSTTNGVEVNIASSSGNASLEVWLDNISGGGTKVATIPVTNTGGTDTWKNFTANFAASGQHDVYLRWVGGANSFFVNTIKFNKGTVVVNTPPTVNITAPVNNASFTAPASISITANAADVDGTISNVQFYNGTTLLGSDAASPYSFSWINVAAGTYSLTAKATDNAGAVTTSTAVTFTVSNPVVQAPFGGTAALIPGKIEAENYDTGGQGVAFNETTTGNSGNTFRTDDVDVEATGDTGGGYNIGWITSGEWLEYTVNVVSVGTYTIEARVASINTGGSLHIEMDGQNISGTITVPNTGAWQTYQTIVLPNVSLTAGQKVMRIAMDAGSFNVNYLNFISVVSNTPPTVSITAPVNNASFTAPASISITANAADVDGTVSTVQFYSGTTLLGSDATSPYSFSWTNVAAGTYSLTAKVTDNAGAVTTSTAVTVTVSNPVVQAPFGGTAALIPGKIEAENYDTGGQGVAFNETTAGNSGNVFRTDDVDVEATGDTGGGYNIGWIASGEWLEYTVNVVSAGVYTIEARIASDNAGGSFHIEMDGQNISGAITVASTGAWQTYQTIVVPNISLTAGQKVMRIVMDGSWFNLNYVNFTSVVSNTTIQAETACLVDGTLNETINTGFRGTGYVNTNNVVGSVASWILNSATAQTISLEIRYAHTTASGRPMSLSVNGVTQVSNIAFGPTAGNTTWTVTTVQISLAAGNNTVRLVSTSAAGSPYLDELVYGSGTVSAGSCSAARIGVMEETVFMTSTISPNPSEHVFRLRTGEEVKSITVVNNLGVVMPMRSYVIEGEEFVFGDGFPSGLYVVVIQYFSGRIETRKIQKI